MEPYGTKNSQKCRQMNPNLREQLHKKTPNKANKNIEKAESVKVISKESKIKNKEEKSTAALSIRHNRGLKCLTKLIKNIIIDFI